MERAKGRLPETPHRTPQDTASEHYNFPPVRVYMEFNQAEERLIANGELSSVLLSVVLNKCTLAILQGQHDTWPISFVGWTAAASAFCIIKGHLALRPLLFAVVNYMLCRLVFSDI